MDRHTEYEVTPLVARDNKGTNETSDDHDQVKEDDTITSTLRTQGQTIHSRDDVGKGQTGREENFQQESGGGNDPILDKSDDAHCWPICTVSLTMYRTYWASQ